MPVTIHPPNSCHESLSRAQFDIDAFMGQWHVIYSSLPLWKTKKDVTITYTPIKEGTSLSSTPSNEPYEFNDIIEFRNGSHDETAERSRFEAVDTLLPPPKDAPEGFENGGAFKWRGKSLLKIAFSKWQVLGYDFEAGWAVTYFETTLFNPAGIDIYSRDERGLPQGLADEIIQKIEEIEGKVGKLGDKLFKVDTSAS